MNPSFTRSVHRRQMLLGMALLLLPYPALAQNKALELARDKSTEAYPSMREDLATIGRYADTVNRQIKRLSGEERGDGGAPPAAAPRPEGNNRPESPVRRLDSIADPFEVSPQLRENRKAGSNFGGLPSSSKLELQRQIQLRAVLITQRGRAAQLAIRQKDTITVMDGELVELGELGTFNVKIDHEGVTLSDPSQPQRGKINLR